MEYTEETLRETLEQNGWRLPRGVIADLEKRIRKKGIVGLAGISFPIIETEGRIKMFSVPDLDYVFLPEDAEVLVRSDEAERKRTKILNTPEEKARLERENNKFWRAYSIRARVIDLRSWQKRTSDSRLNELWEIEKSARQNYIEDMRAREEPFTGADVEIAGAEAVLSYVEETHPDLYGFLQRSMSWFDK